MIIPHGLALTLALLVGTSDVVAAAADPGDAQILAMLKGNTIVRAAVKQGKRFTGARECLYEVESEPLQQFEPGSAYSFTATITCSSRPSREGDGEAGAIITVKGEWLSPMEDVQSIELRIDFAG